MTRKLIIRSNENEDWNDTFLKGEVEQEMKELDNKPTTDTDWICWVLGHMLDCKGYDGLIEKFVSECDTLTKVTLRFDEGEVTIEKI